MRKLAGHLTYANVMASIAVFIALGAGAYAAVNLPKNSVKSKQIKNAQVKNKDLRNEAVSLEKLRDEAVTAAKLAGPIRPLHFDSEVPMGGLIDVLLDENGYRIALTCVNVGGAPELNGTLRVPEDGTLDIQSVTSETGGATDSVNAVQVDVDAATPFPIEVSAPAGSETRTSGVVLTYSGATRSALLTVHGVTNDNTLPNTCSLNGSLIPLTDAEDGLP